MIISKCCSGCGTSSYELHDGLCPWCDTYQSSYKVDLALSVVALGLLVAAVIGLAWIFT